MDAVSSRDNNSQQRLLTTTTSDPQDIEANNNDVLANKDSKQTAGLYSKHLILSVIVSCLSSIQYGYHMSEMNAPELVYSCQSSVPGPNGDYDTSYFGQHGYKQCIPLTSNNIGIVTSIFSIGGLFGSTYSGALADRYGRLLCFKLNSILFIIGSLIASRAQGYYILLLGRFVSGLAAGSGIVVTPLYINEISPLALSGTLGSMNQVSINIGILLTQLVAVQWANDEQWRLILFLGALIGLINFMGSWLIDESPKWLLSCKDQDKQAESFDILMKLRNYDTAKCKFEIDSWQKTRQQQQLNQPRHAPNLKQYLTSSTYYNSRTVVTAIMVGQQFCGINSIIFYGVKVLTHLFPNSSVIVNCFVSILNTVLTFLASFVIDKLGRKPMLMSSVSLMLVSSLVLGIGILTNSSILSVLSICIYVSAFAIGLGPIPFLIISEVSQTEVKGMAQSYGTTLNWLATFLVGYLFPPLNEAIGGAVYIMFAAICLCFVVFIYYKVPETKGKSTFEEVWGIRDN